MDGHLTPCARCGAPLSAGRFCTHCGAPIASAAVAAPPQPASDDTAARGRVYAVPDEPTQVEPPYSRPAYREPTHRDSSFIAPLFADEAYADPVQDRPVYAEPVHAEPPGSQRTPGMGLWIGAAAGLVLVLALGAFLL